MSEQAEANKVLLRTQTTAFFKASRGKVEGVQIQGGRGKVQGSGLNKRGDMTGKKKVQWTKEERCVVWECFVRSGGRQSYGYIKRLMEFWEAKGISDRSQASILSQIKCIEKGGLLSECEKYEIERQVRKEVTAGQDPLYENEFVNNVNNVFVNTEDDNDSNEEAEIDFNVVPSTIVSATADVNVHLLLNRPHSAESFVGKESENENDFEKHEPCIDEDDVEPDFDVNVHTERLDIFEKGENIRVTTEEENKILTRIREVLESNEDREIPSLKSIDKSLVMKEVSVVNCLLRNVIAIGIPDVTKANRLLYAGSFVVCERLGLLKGKRKGLKSRKPWWQRRLEKSIAQWRKDLGRISEIKNGKVLKTKFMQQLERRYQLSERGTRTVTVFLETKIKAASTKIKFFLERNLTKRHNTLYKNNQSYLYKELSGNNSPNKPPNKDEAKEFWSNIWSVEGSFRENAGWLEDVSTSFRDVERQLDIDITASDVKKGISRMANWKAPGPDGVRGFWFKKFTSLHPYITDALDNCLWDGTVPNWMVKGRTVLIQKDPAKGTVAGNYRPIACLPLMWKLLTGIFAGKIYEHLESNGLLPEEQKGCRKRSRGTKDQLLIDKAVLKQAKRMKHSLSMAWVDYRKAYDLVPHSWLLKIMDLTKIAGNIKELIENSMGMWNTELSCAGDKLGNINIKRGIFQGDSLSPLLFIMAMIPLSMLLNKEVFGYKFKNCPTKINHLFFMDDLKLYGKTERELNELMSIVDNFSSDIGMEFGFDKCAMLVMKAGVKVKSEGIVLPTGDIIKEVEESGYKYLGILQESDVKHREMKEKIRNEYLRRVKLLAKSKLYARNLFPAINAWAVSVIRYSAGILDWRETELKAMDVKTRKILTMNNVFHRKGNVSRLYMKRKEGGRGLISTEDCVNIEQLNLEKYMLESEERLVLAAKDVLQVDADIENGKEYKERVTIERVESLHEKPMHGKWFKDNEGASPKSFRWIASGYVDKRTEGFVFAAQEQAIKTNWLTSRISGGEVDNRCRICRKFPETVAHVATGCKILAQREYKKRHDRMGLRVYWELCKKYGMQHSHRWYEETPEAVRVSNCGRFEIWWDKPVNTSKRLDHNRPDVILIDRDRKYWTIIDFSVPNDKNVEDKVNEKLNNYEELAKEIRKIHKVKTKIVPLVVGALGVVPETLERNLKYLEIPHVFLCMQITAVLGTVIILRKTLNL